MKQHILLLTTISLSTLTVGSMYQTYVKTPGRIRPLFICLDDSENGTLRQAICTGTAISALMQEAGPIIISGSLLHNVFHYFGIPNVALDSYYGEIQSILGGADVENKETTVKRLNALKAASQVTKHDILYVVLQQFQQSFNPQRWIFKKINDYLYLLLPRWQLSSSVSQLSNPNLTQSELTTGLKSDHLETLMVGDKEIVHVKQLRDYFDAKAELYVTTKEHYQDGASYFTNAIGTIFVSNAEYAAQNKPTIGPEWVIYLVGHGISGTLVAGLSIAQFRSWLDFIAHKLTMNLFIYSACYATGISAQKMYQDSTQQSGYTAFDFPIIVYAITDIRVWGIFPQISIANFTIDDIDFATKLLKIKSVLQPRAFIDAVSQSRDVIEYNKILPSIMIDIERGGPLYVANTPQIRLPGLEWFSVFDLGIKTISITNVMSQTRKQPLDIGSFARARSGIDPDAILFYADYVPFALNISTKKFPVLISMIPGKSFHVIQKITTQHSLMELPFNLFQVQPAMTKTFLIRDYETPDGVAHNVVAVQGVKPELYATIGTIKKYMHWTPAGWDELSRDYMYNFSPQVDSSQSGKAQAVAQFFEQKVLLDAIDKGDRAGVIRELKKHPSISEEIVERAKKLDQKAKSSSEKAIVNNIAALVDDYREKSIREPQRNLDAIFKDAMSSDPLGWNANCLLRLVKAATYDDEALASLESLVSIYLSKGIQQTRSALEKLVRFVDSERRDAKELSELWQKEGRLKRAFKKTATPLAIDTIASRL